MATLLGRSTAGAVTLAELESAGVPHATVGRLVSRGVLCKLWPGTYVAAPQPVTIHAKAHAAVKSAAASHRDARAQPRAVVTGLAGCAATGTRWVPQHDRVQLLVGPEVRRTSNEHVLYRRTADVADIVTRDWAGVPVADPARLIVDGARECTSLRDVRGLVLGAVADGRTTAQELLRLADSGARAGTGWLRRAARDAVRGAASPPEAEVADSLIGCGWPFLLNAEVHVDDELLAVLDVYLLGTGVGGEVDSVERHGSSDALHATFMRDDAVEAAGIQLVHVTPAKHRADPYWFRSQLAAKVKLRRTRGLLADPAGVVIRPRGPVLR